MSRVWAYLPCAKDDERVRIGQLLGRDIAHWFTDPATRQLVMNGVRAGDVLVIGSLNDLGRTATTVLQRIVPLLECSVTVVAVREGLTLRPDHAGLLAPFTRVTPPRLSRSGPPPRLSDDILEDVQRRVTAGETILSIAADLGVHRTTLYRALGRKHS